MTKTIDVTKHIFSPKHEILADKEAEELLLAYNISHKQMPSISIKDPGIQHLEAKMGNIIKISRKSPTAGTSIFYRVVRGA